MSGPRADLVLFPARLGRARRWPRLAAGAALPALGTAAMSVCLGVAVAITLAAAERPSMLSGPARHGFPAWMVGPLAHRLPGLPDDPPALAGDLTRALVVLGLAWIVATVCASRVPAPVVWTAAIGAQVVLLLGPPLSLTDLFNYLHYGRMEALYGLNPYVSAPLTAPRTRPTFLQLAPPALALRPALHAGHGGPGPARRWPRPTGRGRRSRSPPRWGRW